MIPRRVLLVLVFCWAVLIVVFAVVMAFYALVSALGDTSAAQLLLGVGVACLMLLVANLILLVGCLGINAAAPRDDESVER